MVKLRYLCLVLAFGFGFFTLEIQSQTEQRESNDRNIPAVSEYQELESRLRELIETRWKSYISDTVNRDGGIAMRILSPRGDFFLSTSMGDATENIHFRGASTTKTFTAASILLLQQRGMLNIDDAITDLIPGSREPYIPDNAAYAIPYKDQITIKLLLKHRSGVFDVSNNNIPETVQEPYAGKRYIEYVREDLGEDSHTFTIDELVGVVAANKLSFTPPETEFHYSDTGYSILGKIIERVSGKSYDEFVRTNFLIPNNLLETGFPFQGNDQVIPYPYAEGYTWFQGQVYTTTIDNISPHVAEGNVISTPSDLANWIKYLIDGVSGLNPEYVQMMTDVEATEEFHQYYGLGCVYTPELGYGHNGGHIGYLTVVRYDPVQDVCILLFTTGFNADDLSGQTAFMYDVGRSAKKY